MRLNSALEDFEGHTLAVLPDVMQRLAYVWSLRGEDGRFRHWGMEATYGEEKSTAAIQDAFYNLLLGMVRTPFIQLVPMLASSKIAGAIEEILEGMGKVPKAGQELRHRHFVFVLETLRDAGRARAAA